MTNENSSSIIQLKTRKRNESILLFTTKTFRNALFVIIFRVESKKMNFFLTKKFFQNTLHVFKSIYCYNLKFVEIYRNNLPPNKTRAIFPTEGLVPILYLARNLTI